SRTPGIPSFVEWRNETCAVSTLPSRTCSQLHSTIHMATRRWLAGTVAHSICGSSGGVPGPIYTQTVSPRWSGPRSEEHTSELQSRENLVCRLLLEKKKKTITISNINTRK